MAWFCPSNFLRKFADNALGQFARWFFGVVGHPVDTDVDVHFDAVPTAEFVQDRFKRVFDQPPHSLASLPFVILITNHTPVLIGKMMTSISFSSSERTIGSSLPFSFI